MDICVELMARYLIKKLQLKISETFDDFKHIASGRKDYIIESSESFDSDIVISYGRTFTDAPEVICSLSDYSRGYINGGPRTSIGIYYVSNSSFTARIKSDKITTGTLIIFWIAIRL